MSSHAAHVRGFARGAVLAVLWSTVIGFPLYLVVINSLKPLSEAQLVGISVPQDWSSGFQNYVDAAQGALIGTGLRNTAIITVISVALILICSSMAAWQFARSRSSTVRVLYYLSIVGVMIPPAIIPSILVVKTIGLGGTMIGLVLFYSATYMALAVFLVTGFVKGIPVELEAAARIDGASSLRIFFSVILPLLRPILFTLSVFLIVIVWNEYFYAQLMLAGEKNLTLVVGLDRVAGGALYQTRWNLVYAHVVLVSLPLVVAYAALQKRVTGGLMQGSLKG